MLIFSTLVAQVFSNVIGIDFGTEFIKTSLIKPGKKLVIIENEESQRQVLSTLSFTQSEILFESKAESNSIKDPKSSISNIKSFLGQPYSASQSLINSTNGGISFQIHNRSISAEEAASLLLMHIQKTVSAFADTSITDCVVTVPATFGTREKQSLSSAIKLAGLNLLTYINENTASILYHSIDRIDDSTDHTVMVFNFGSGYTQVSVFTLWGYYQGKKYLSFVEALGHEATSKFSGRLIERKMAEKIGKDVKEKLNFDLNEDEKAVGKILKAMKEEKKKLSSNKKSEVFIERVVNGKDYRSEITRDIIEEIVESQKFLFISLAEKLLTRLNIPIQGVSSFEFIGGISKIPKIQEVVEKHFGVKVSSRIHPTESAAYGAALMAAKKSVSVTTGSFSVKDVTTCGLSISSPTFKKILPVSSSFDSVTFTVQPDDSPLILTESCEENLPIAEYTFNQTDPFQVTLNYSQYLTPSLTALNPVFSFKDLTVPSMLKAENLAGFSENLIELIQLSQRKETLKKSKNDLESVFYYIKEKMTESSFKSVLNEKETERIEGLLNNITVWIESSQYELATDEEFKRKMEDIRNDLLPLLEKEKDLKVRDAMFDQGRKYITHLKEFLKLVNETAPWIPKAELNDGWALLKETEIWVEDKIEKQGLLKPWDTPAVSTKEFDSKIMFLKKKLERFLEYKEKNR